MPTKNIVDAPQSQSHDGQAVPPHPPHNNNGMAPGVMPHTHGHHPPHGQQHSMNSMTHPQHPPPPQPNPYYNNYYNNMPMGGPPGSMPPMPHQGYAPGHAMPGHHTAPYYGGPPYPHAPPHYANTNTNTNGSNDTGNNANPAQAQNQGAPTGNGNAPSSPPLGNNSTTNANASNNNVNVLPKSPILTKTSQSNNQSSSSSQRNIIAEPRDHDIIYGKTLRGRTNHPGNVYYRSVLRKFFKRYSSSSASDKPKFAYLIHHEMSKRDPPGRFLQASESCNGWEEMSQKEALNYILNVLNDCVRREKKRKEANSKSNGGTSGSGSGSGSGPSQKASGGGTSSNNTMNEKRPREPSQDNNDQENIHGNSNNQKSARRKIDESNEVVCTGFTPAPIQPPAANQTQTDEKSNDNQQTLNLEKVDTSGARPVTGTSDQGQIQQADQMNDQSQLEQSGEVIQQNQLIQAVQLNDQTVYTQSDQQLVQQGESEMPSNTDGRIIASCVHCDKCQGTGVLALPASSQQGMNTADQLATSEANAYASQQPPPEEFDDGSTLWSQKLAQIEHKWGLDIASSESMTYPERIKRIEARAQSQVAVLEQANLQVLEDAHMVEMIERAEKKWSIEVPEGYNLAQRIELIEKTAFNFMSRLQVWL